MRLTVCFILTLLAPAISLAATISYSFEMLDRGYEFNALNNRGWLTGHTADDNYFPVRYRPSAGYESLLNTIGNGLDVNDAGTVVGWLSRSGGMQAFMRPAGQPWAALGTLGGRGWSYANAINEAGQVVGRATLGPAERHAFLYTAASGITDLGTLGGTFSDAFDINEAGQILGHSTLVGNRVTHAFLYDPVEGMIDLTEEIGQPFYATSISDTGVITGTLQNGTKTSAAVYSRTTGLRKLGTLGGSNATWRASNDRGWSVGNSTLAGDEEHAAFLYVYGRGLMPLNSLTPGLDVSLSDVIDINDRNQILASAVVDGNLRYYLLTRIRDEAVGADMVATPEPSTWVLMALGLGVVEVFRRRR